MRKQPKLTITDVAKLNELLTTPDFEDLDTPKLAAIAFLPEPVVAAYRLQFDKLMLWAGGHLHRRGPIDASKN